MGILFVLSGVFFLAGVLDPPILPTWGGSVTDVMTTASAHRAAWFASTWLITLSIVAGLAAVELLARTLDTDLARVGRTLYVVGSALGLASTTYDLAVTSTLLRTDELPDWYLGVQHWADGLGTAYFALLAPAAMGCLGAGDPAYPCAAGVAGLRPPDRDRPAARAVRRLPGRAAVPAVPRIHRPRHRGAGRPGASVAQPSTRAHRPSTTHRQWRKRHDHPRHARPPLPADRHHHRDLRRARTHRRRAGRRDLVRRPAARSSSASASPPSA